MEGGEVAEGEEERAETEGGPGGPRAGSQSDPGQ